MLDKCINLNDKDVGQCIYCQHAKTNISKMKSLLVFICIAYVLWSTHVIFDMRRELNVISVKQERLSANLERVGKEEDVADIHDVFRFKRAYPGPQADSPAAPASFQKKRLPVQYDCKAVKKCIKRRGKKPKKTRRNKKKGGKKTKGRTEKISKNNGFAAHFSSDESNFEPPQNTGTGATSRWDGSYDFSKYLYVNKDPDQVLKFIDKSNLPDTITSPVKRLNEGTFEVLKRGLYLIYMNVVAVVYSTRHRVKLNIDGQTVLRCESSFDLFYDRSRNKSHPLYNDENDQYSAAPSKTCGVTGLFYLKNGSIISPQLAEANSGIDIRESTNLGFLLLSQG